jgi:hypothetical protein
MSSKYFDNKTAFLEPVVTQYGSNMLMTNVHKPSKTKFINIDTRFSNEWKTIKNDFNNMKQYTIDLPMTISDVKTLSVSQIEIPVSFYTISSALRNNTFLLINLTLNVRQVVEIKDGDYTADSMITTLNLINTDLTFSINSNTNFIEILNNSVYTYCFDFFTDNYLSVVNNIFKSQLGWIMGFRMGIYQVIPSASIEAESIFNNNTTRYLFLVIDQFTNLLPDSFSSILSESTINKNIIARISCSRTLFPFGSVISGNEQNAVIKSDIRTYTGKTDIQKLSIQLVNEIGIPINLNGLDFSFLIKIEYE